MAAEESSEEIDIGLKEIPGTLRFEWRRRTWYGRLFYPGVVLIGVLVLPLLIVLVRIVEGVAAIEESIEKRWPAKIREEYADD